MEEDSLFAAPADAPLAARLRPRTLDEFVGQEQLLGPGKILRNLIEEDRITSMIFWGPPGVGKTTRLRDLIRCLSTGGWSNPKRVGVADERGELGVGSLRAFLGPRVDVLAYCPKAAALGMLLRGMSPQVLAADEITDPQDIRAMEQAAGCGVTLLATAHGGSLEDLRRRPLYREL